MVAINAAESSGMPALIQQYRQAGIDAKLVCRRRHHSAHACSRWRATATDGIISADIYFSDIEPFAKIPRKRPVRAGVPEGPRRGARQGRGARRRRRCMVWARAAAATKSLDRKTVAEAIRGKTLSGTLFGDVTFLPNGQMQSRHVVFKVVDGKTMKIEVLK